jgi:hypothetical protein
MSLLLSFVAVIISLGVPLFEYMYNKNINKINLLSEYYKDIYNEFLVKKIPQARQFIHYNGVELSGTDSMLEILRELRENSIYFKYNDNEFYKRLLSVVQKVEDKLVVQTGEMTNEEHANFYSSFETDLGHVYECISNRYMGKKIKKIK